MTPGLPPYLRKLRDRLRSALNHLDALERLEVQHAWGRHEPERMAKAINNIEQCVLLAADLIGVRPKEVQFYRDIIARLQDENQRLTEANVARVQRRDAA